MAHILIFGASGISGWAAAKEALSYPSPTTFARVTALTNRPLSIEDSKLPGDDRLELASGVNLLESAEVVARSLKEKLKSVDSISHVIFTAYMDPGTGFEALREKNVAMLKSAVQAVSLLSDKLQSVVLQTGGKGYGVEFPDKVNIIAPLKESYPRIAEPEYSKIFYYFQVDALAELSKGQSWTFTEVRPDVIIGFVPGTNFMNCAQGLAFYLSLYRAVHGEGAAVPFPGSKGGWTCKHSDSSQDIIAKFEIYAALNPDKCGDGRAFNIADGATVTWEQKWPGICAYFGLKGEGPLETEPVDEFVGKHVKEWNELVQKHDLKQGMIDKYDWKFLYFVTSVFGFDRQYDLTAARSVGFEESVNTVDGYRLAFDRMRASKTIP